MKKVLISLLALGTFMPLHQNINLSVNNHISKNLKLLDDFNESEEYEEDDYEYDGFLDYVFTDAIMENDEENIIFSGYTSFDYGEFKFRLDFNLEYLSYTYDFADSEIDVSCDQAMVDEYGRLESEIVIYNPESGNIETYKVSDFRDIEDLEGFVLNPEDYSASINSVSTCGLLKNVMKAIAAIVTTYVVVSETAEQIKARHNYRDNQALESSSNGVNNGNYITNQSEENRDGYNCAHYKFGFAEFKDVGCEVASIYNLMISKDVAQDLSEVIYNFEKWAIEFSVGWGNLGSNPRDIYRYLRKYGIKYSKRSFYSSFKRKVNDADSGTRFIMSTWNNAFNEGLHTFFFVKCDNYLETYNFKYSDSTRKYTDLDDIYSETGLFIVGYKINE